MASKHLIQPIQALHQHVSNLEAAINLTLADPQPRPVHRLRTSTRRIEALLTLLDLLPELPDHASPSRKARKLLKKIRRAAGNVRDLDVQQDLVHTLKTAPKPGSEPRPSHPPVLPHHPLSSPTTSSTLNTTPGTTPATTKETSLATSRNTIPEIHPQASPASASGKFRHQLHKHAARLAHTLAHQRRQEAADLTRILAKLHPRLTRVLTHLLESLNLAQPLTLAPEELASVVRTWYAHHTPNAAEILSTQDPHLLHAIRKSAKLARYLAELTPQTPQTPVSHVEAPAPHTPAPHTPAPHIPARLAKNRTSAPSALTFPAPSPPKLGDLPSLTASAPSQLAAAFEALQQAGGSWHDLLTLADISRHHLGKRSPLTRHLETARDQALETYRNQASLDLN